MKSTLALLTSSLVLFCLSAAAQTKRTQNTAKPAALKSSLGTYQGNAGITRENAIAAIKLPLRIIDSKTNKEYKISSYQIVYKQKTVKEDNNGKPVPSYLTTIQLFKSTPLPAIWISELSQKLQPGEEIKFCDIIAKDDKGLVQYAPDLILSIR